MVNGGHYIREALLHFTRCLLLPAGTGLETRSEQQVELMRRFGVTVIVGFVDYIRHLAEVARDRGTEPGRDIPVRMISGHLGQEDRRALSAAWGGAAVFDWYGVADTGILAAEGPDQDGLYVWEDAHYVEIVDPDSGAPRPDGACGNVCVTVLFKDRVAPIIRFDTNDVSAFLTAPAATGIGFRRIRGLEGRSDQMVKLRGINVYPTAVGAYLAEHPAAAGEYVCRVERDERVATDGRGDRGARRRPANAAHRRRARRLLRAEARRRGRRGAGRRGRHPRLTQLEARQKPIRLIDRRQRRAS